MTQTNDPTQSVIDVRCRLLACESMNRSLMSAASHHVPLQFVDAQKAFDDLVQTTGDDPAAEHPQYHEYWQYMGSMKWGAVLYHQFRHRQHPLFDRRFYAAVREIC